MLVNNTSYFFTQARPKLAMSAAGTAATIRVKRRTLVLQGLNLICIGEYFIRGSVAI